ncbi:MAG: hypothetical protein M3Y72_09590 [Acidobacteriota bacterium]|nr:hypothetical protein [Acidobacteriota bacterium]
MARENPGAAERPQLFGFAKVLVELGALWAAFGYFSLRSYCNYHDIPLIPGLGIERYLQEAYEMSLYTATKEVGSRPYLLLVIAGSIFALLPRTWGEKIERTAMVALDGKTLLWILFACVLVSAAAFGAITARLVFLKSSLLGDLKASGFATDGESYYDLSLFLAFISWSSFWLSRKGLVDARLPFAKASRRILGCFLLVFSVISTVYVPIVYGADVRALEYYVIRMQISDGAPAACGLRLLESSTQILYWHAENGRGRITSVPTSRIKLINYLGFEDIRCFKEFRPNLPPECGSDNAQGGRK